MRDEDRQTARVGGVLLALIVAFLMIVVVGVVLLIAL